MPSEQTALSPKDFAGICMSILQRLRTHRLAPLSSALILLLGLFGSLLYWHYSQTNAQTERGIYGQALANSASQRAVSPTLSQDLISLQVILQELDQYPHVIGATIHDVENQLLVQSGYSPGELAEREHQTYSSAIALHDNVAGYLRVVVQVPQMTGGDRQFFGFWTLMILVAATLPWLKRFPFGFAGLSDDDTAIENTPQPERDELEPLEPSVTLRLNLELLNLPLLYQQLNLESFAQLVERFDYQLKGVLTLYTGKRRLLSEHRMLIDFEATDAAEGALRALCSAQLLKQLSDANPGPKLRLSARIQPLPEAESLAQEFVVQQSPGTDRQQAGVFIAPELVDDGLIEHLEFDATTGRLQEIKSPYKALLNKQQQQLQNRTHSDPHAHQG